MHRTYELAPLLLIEGISVPVSRAQVTYGINRPAIGVFDVVPLQEINDIKPRTLCQLFVKNYMGTKTDKGVNNDYILAYEGEVYSYGFGCHASGERMFQIRCMDFTNYFDNALVYFTDHTKALASSGTLGTNAAEAKASNVDTVSTVTGILSNIASKVLDYSKSTQDIALMVGKLAGEIIKINAFFKANAARTQLFDKLISTSSGKLDEFFKYPLTKDLVDSQLGNIGQMQSFRDILQLYMGLIYHEMITIPFPIMGDKVPKHFLIKPEAYVLAPPACNVIFPNQYYNMNIERNFFAEVTRARMVTPPFTSYSAGQPQVIDRVFAAPAFYEEILAVKYKFANTYLQTPDFQTSKPVVGAKFGKPSKDPDNPTNREINDYSPEEVMKGVFMAPPIYPTLSTSYLIEAAKNKQEDQVNRMYQNALYYEFYKGRYAQRRSNISGRLNFAAVPGFNVLFIDATDAHQNVIGMLESITHIFGTGQGSSTIYDVSYVRNVEEKQSYGSTAFADPPIPPWYNNGQFGTTGEADKVLSKEENSPGAKIRAELGSVSGPINNFSNSMDSYFKNILGVGSVTSVDYKTLPEASRHYVDLYNGAEDKEAFVRGVIQRPFATISQVMGAMGARQASYSEVANTIKAEYTGGLLESYPDNDAPEWNTVKNYFNDSLKQRRSVIKKYSVRLGNHISFGGR